MAGTEVMETIDIIYLVLDILYLKDYITMRNRVCSTLKVTVYNAYHIACQMSVNTVTLHLFIFHL